MALYAELGNAALTTGSGNSTTVTTAQQAKALLLLLSAQTATGFAAGASLDHGFSDGDGVADGCGSLWQADNSALGTAPNSLFAGYKHSGQLHVTEEVTTNQQTNWQFSTATLGPTSFTLTVATPAPSVASLFDWVALGGSELQVAAGNFALRTTAGTTPVSGLGFRPTLVLFFWGTWKDDAGGGGQGANASTVLGYGAADGINQWAVCVGGQTPTNTIEKTIQRTDRCIISISLSALDEDASFTSIDPDGFTITMNTVGGRAISIGWVAFGGVQGQVGSFNKSTAAAPVTDIVALATAPRAVFLASHGTVASTALQADGTLSVGFADGTKHGHVWIGMKDGQSTTGAHTRHTTDKAITIALATATGTTPTVVAEADVNFSGNNVNVHWTTNDATGDQVLYWALSDPIPVPQPTYVGTFG